MYQLNPTYQIKENDEENNARIIQTITETLCDQSKSSLITLKNQLYFVKHYHERGKKIISCKYYFYSYSLVLFLHM